MFIISARSSTPGLMEERRVDAWGTRDRIQAGPSVPVSPDISDCNGVSLVILTAWEQARIPQELSLSLLGIP
jgi:hypothetical protein